MDAPEWSQATGPVAMSPRVRSLGDRPIDVVGDSDRRHLGSVRRVGTKNPPMLPFSPRRFRAYRDDLSQAILELSRERRPEFHELTQDLRNVVQRNMTFDLKKMSKDDLVRELDKGDVQAGTTERVEKWIGDQIMEVEWFTKTETTKVTMTPIDRLKDKLKQASGVASRSVAGIEAEADGLIAQEDAIRAKTTRSFAPHKAILAEAHSELQAIEDALNLMSNGGPALDPLSDAEPTASDSNPA